MFVTPAMALAYTSPGSPQGYVSDFAHVLSAQEVQKLNAALSQFEASTSNQIAVVTVPNLGGDYIENYAVKLFAEWGIGTKNKDNGVLLLLAIEERDIRIEVGYGLEGALPDSVAQRIINNDLTPSLKKGAFDQGVEAAVADIMLATQGEYTEKDKKTPLSGNAIEAILLAAFFALQWIAAVLARSKSWWAGGIVGGVIGVAVSLFFGFLLVWGALLVFGLVGFGLMLDYIVSKKYNEAKSAGTTLPWFFGGGGGRSGGGFGGFGGGRSGGGGASGGW